MANDLDFALAPPSEIDRIATEICGHDAVRAFITDAEQMCTLHGVIQEVLAARSPPPAVEGGWRDIASRITDYLSAGGLFNPELMDHQKVRDLLIDARDALAGKKA